jgi:hypothetical protein
VNANAVTKHYNRLTPEERFRLIVAAGVRGDQAEQARLVNSGKRITLSMSDHSPYGHAFWELALIAFIQLLEDAGDYLECLQHSADDAELVEEAHFGERPDEDSQGEADATDGEGPAEKAGLVPCLDIALGLGYMLRARVDGWKLFCARLTIPPFAMWEKLPGFDRLQRALAAADGSDGSPAVAFTATGMLRWLNSVRPKGRPPRTEVPLTAETVARQKEELFREGVALHAGLAHRSG